MECFLLCDAERIAVTALGRAVSTQMLRIHLLQQMPNLVFHSISAGNVCTGGYSRLRALGGWPHEIPSEEGSRPFLVSKNSTTSHQQQLLF
jgi:hypothetical protein